MNHYDNTNKNEWKAASGMLESGTGYDTLIDNTVKLYNPGVKETDFVLTLNFVNGIIPAGGINIGADAQLNFKIIISQNGDDQIKINTKLNLIEGYKNGKKSGMIYNKYITSGTFFKIPVSDGTDMILILNQIKAYFDSIEYDYIYF